MTDQKPPAALLKSDSDPSDWEAKSVTQKFSQADAAIGEDNVDYVALGHMNPQAAAYWLPSFLRYLREKAPADSFHYESMLYKLSDNGWTTEMKDAFAAPVQGDIRSFLSWLSGQPFMQGAPPLRQKAYDYAVELWRTR